MLSELSIPNEEKLIEIKHDGIVVDHLCKSYLPEALSTNVGVGVLSTSTDSTLFACNMLLALQVFSRFLFATKLPITLLHD